ncbi:cytochrome b5 family heme steroid binding domain-containing protein [Cystoisospora suis]|uniref:Cytochrome b5 family heme steroid binding domain-containing protein n=1 Tax=Cystoisospora suis TaxID=483139 RepID=A0A2C6K3R4_9APIC|nr:cytochrome b5 family heme steroid binding domain-containing protein [Cystoisospora suis]
MAAFAPVSTLKSYGVYVWERLDFWTLASVALGSVAIYKMLKVARNCASLCPAHYRCFRASGDRCGEGAVDAEYYKARPKPDPCPRDFTVKELRSFDGRNSFQTNAPAAASLGAAAAASGALPPIYVSLRGRVYDVTSHPDGRRFYGPDGPYSIFAGRDVTMNLAKMVFEESENNVAPSKWKTISAVERRTLDDWEERFKQKYDHVGYVFFGDPEEDKLLQALYREERLKAGLGVDDAEN